MRTPHVPRGDDPRPPRLPRDDDARPPRARGPVPGLPEPAEGLPDLLATLGRYLETHPPGEVAVVLREEMARREFQAYASGWRDAADQYEPVLEEARRIAQTRRLRLVGRTPGQAAVIPFPRDGVRLQGGADADGTAARSRTPRDPAAPRSPGPGRTPTPGRPRDGDGQGGAADRDPAQQGPGPRAPRQGRTARQDGTDPLDPGGRQGGAAAPGHEGSSYERPAAPQDAPRTGEPRARTGGKAPGAGVNDPRTKGPRAEADAPRANDPRAEGDDPRAEAEAPRAADAPRSRAGARTGGAPSGLVAKSPGSRVPTIPRLTTRRRGPADRAPDQASDGAPDHVREHAPDHAPDRTPRPPT
ncbi:hypothetical protein [Streptomyces thermolilacinus]|uniref:hypothetical protein n=1 Tax=Streptomyces thermolilacinus TaxID=285540 RepID=UPI00340D2D34